MLSAKVPGESTECEGSSLEKNERNAAASTSVHCKLVHQRKTKEMQLYPDLFTVCWFIREERAKCSCIQFCLLQPSSLEETQRNAALSRSVYTKLLHQRKTKEMQLHPDFLTGSRFIRRKLTKYNCAQIYLLYVCSLEKKERNAAAVRSVSCKLVLQRKTKEMQLHKDLFTVSWFTRRK